MRTLRLVLPNRHYKSLTWSFNLIPTGSLQLLMKVAPHWGTQKLSVTGKFNSRNEDSAGTSEYGPSLLSFYWSTEVYTINSILSADRAEGDLSGTTKEFFEELCSNYFLPQEARSTTNEQALSWSILSYSTKSKYRTVREYYWPRNQRKVRQIPKY